MIRTAKYLFYPHVTNQTLHFRFLPKSIVRYVRGEQWSEPEKRSIFRVPTRFLPPAISPTDCSVLCFRHEGGYGGKDIWRSPMTRRFWPARKSGLNKILRAMRCSRQSERTSALFFIQHLPDWADWIFQSRITRRRSGQFENVYNLNPMPMILVLHFR
jgi:hypothetical protein